MRKPIIYCKIIPNLVEPSALLETVASVKDKLPKAKKAQHLQKGEEAENTDITCTEKGEISCSKVTTAQKMLKPQVAAEAHHT